MGLERKYFIENLGSLYLDGHSLRGLAKMFNLSHVTVRSNLLSIHKVNLALYHEVLDAMEQRQPDSLKKQNVRNRVILAYQKFLNEDKTVIQIAEELVSTEFIIYRDLTVRLPIINNYIEDKIPTSEIKRVFEQLKRHALNNLTPGNPLHK